MKTTLALHAAALLLFVCGCDLVELVRGEPGSGVAATEKRDIEEFHRLEFSGAANLEIVCGEAPGLTVSTDDNLLEWIETRVQDGRLKIRSTRRINPTITPTFQITTRQLDRIDMAGSGNITIDGLSGEQFRFELAGSGKMNASGEVDRADIQIAGSGSIDLTGLVARDVTVDIAGSGKGTVHATESLDVEIAGSGDIQYIGSPKIRREIAGSGRVRPAQAPVKAEREDPGETGTSTASPAT